MRLSLRSHDSSAKAPRDYAALVWTYDPVAQSSAARQRISRQRDFANRYSVTRWPFRSVALARQPASAIARATALPS